MQFWPVVKYPKRLSIFSSSVRIQKQEIQRENCSYQYINTEQWTEKRHPEINYQIDSILGINFLQWYLNTTSWILKWREAELEMLCSQDKTVNIRDVSWWDLDSEKPEATIFQSIYFYFFDIFITKKFTILFCITIIFFLRCMLSSPRNS